MGVLKVSSRDYIEDKVIENLLNAHEQACKQVNLKAILKLTKHLRKLSQKRKDELVEIWSEEDEHSTQKPPDEC